MNDFLRRWLFLPEQGSEMAVEIDHLHYFVILTTFIASTAIGLSAFYFFVRYRRRRVGQTTEHIESPRWQEVLFVGVPLVFFLTWFFIGYRDFIRLTQAPPGAMDVYVMGKKWMWKFAYPDGPGSLSTLRVPARRPVRLLLTSRDVIHSFYVPAFRVKRDAIPGRYTELWFEARAPGRYRIFCAEYCGAGHSSMWGEVVAMEPDAFDAWIAAARRGLAEPRDVSDGVPPAADLAREGERVAARHGCYKCHSIDGTPHIGPTWLDLYLRRERLADGTTIVADEPYLTESMMDPRARVVAGFQPVMPTFQGRLSAPEVAALLEHIRSLTSARLAPTPSEAPAYGPLPRR
jgi:cytochrome c oxidase subunit 2